MTTAPGQRLPAPDEHDGGPITVLVAAARQGTRTAITSVLGTAPSIRAVGATADVSGTLAVLASIPSGRRRRRRVAAR